MIHTVYIDDSTNKGKQLLEKLKKEQDIVYFTSPESIEIQDKHLTSSEFRKSVKSGLIKKLQSNGYL